MIEVFGGPNMRIFVFEYMSGGGQLEREQPDPLTPISETLLEVLLSDLAELDDVDIVMTRDTRFAPPGGDVECQRVATPAEFTEAWNACVDSADAVWPIAPTRQGILERISAEVLERGATLIGSDPETLHITSGRARSARHLQAHGIRAVPVFRREDRLSDFDGGWLLVPDDETAYGGGRIFPDRRSLRSYWQRQHGECELVAQPFLKGSAIGLCGVLLEGHGELLGVNRQRVAVMDGALILLGCRVNGLREQRERHRELVNAIAAALPRLWGLVSIDLIENGAEPPYVLGVRSGVTVDYLGLRESLGINPVRMLLDLAAGRGLPPRWTLAGHTVDVDYAQ